MYSLNLLLESSVKELDQQVLLPIVLSVVEHGQNHVLHESIGTVLRHLKDQLSKVVWVGLQEVEQMLISLHAREKKKNSKYKSTFKTTQQTLYLRMTLYLNGNKFDPWLF